MKTNTGIRGQAECETSPLRRTQIEWPHGIGLESARNRPIRPSRTNVNKTAESTVIAGITESGEAVLIYLDENDPPAILRLLGPALMAEVVGTIRST